MKKEPKYDNLETAKMGWFKFFKYFYLSFAIIINLGYAKTFFGYIGIFTELNIFEFGIILCLIVTFKKFKKYSYDGIKWIIAYLVLNSIISLVFLAYGSSDMLFLKLIPSLAFCVPTLFYIRNRKPIFEKKEKEEEGNLENIAKTEELVENEENNDKNEESIEKNETNAETEEVPSKRREYPHKGEAHFQLVDENGRYIGCFYESQLDEYFKRKEKIEENKKD